MKLWPLAGLLMLAACAPPAHHGVCPYDPVTNPHCEVCHPVAAASTVRSETAMDPDATLDAILLETDLILNCDPNADPDHLAELVESLHDWIVRGGALPRAWEAR